MKNLKRVLALVMVFAMVMSVSAFANWSYATEEEVEAFEAGDDRFEAEITTRSGDNAEKEDAVEVKFEVNDDYDAMFTVDGSQIYPATLDISAKSSASSADIEVGKEALVEALGEKGEGMFKLLEKAGDKGLPSEMFFPEMYGYGGEKTVNETVENQNATITAQFDETYTQETTTVTKLTTTYYYVDEDGNYVLDEDGNKIVAEVVETESSETSSEDKTDTKATAAWELKPVKTNDGFKILFKTNTDETRAAWAYMTANVLDLKDAYDGDVSKASIGDFLTGLLTGKAELDKGGQFALGDSKIAAKEGVTIALTDSGESVADKLTGEMKAKLEEENGNPLLKALYTGALDFEAAKKDETYGEAFTKAEKIFGDATEPILQMVAGINSLFGVANSESGAHPVFVFTVAGETKSETVNKSETAESTRLYVYDPATGETDVVSSDELEEYIVTYYGGDDDIVVVPVTIEEEATPLAATPFELAEINSAEEVLDLAVELGIFDESEDYEAAADAAAETVTAALAAVAAEDTDVAAVIEDSGVDFGEVVTREELVTALYALAADMGYDVSASADLSAFTDAGDLSETAAAAMQWAVEVGLINGKGDGILDPAGTLTQEQLLLIIARFMALTK